MRFHSRFFWILYTRGKNDNNFVADNNQLFTQRYIANVFIRFGFSLLTDDDDSDDNVADDVCVC